MFSGEENSNGNVENEVSVTCYPPKHWMMKLAPAEFHCNFPLFLWPRKFLADACKCLPCSFVMYNLIL